jgi:hypothetical protein
MKTVHFFRFRKQVCAYDVDNLVFGEDSMPKVGQGPWALTLSFFFIIMSRKGIVVAQQCSQTLFEPVHNPLVD